MSDESLRHLDLIHLSLIINFFEIGLQLSMEFVYQLSFSGETLDLFVTDSDCQSEADLISHIESLPKSKNFRLGEIVIALLFDKFETKDHESFHWADNLKTLLAHGFSIFNSTTQSTIQKSYHPLQFSLFSEKTMEWHHFGRFYLEEKNNIGEQFVKFCRLSEYPPKINEHIILGVLLNDGGRLVGNSGNAETVLIKCDPRDRTISGDDAVIDFFSTPVTQQVA